MNKKLKTWFEAALFVQGQPHPLSEEVEIRFTKTSKGLVPELRLSGELVKDSWSITLLVDGEGKDAEQKEDRE